MPLPIAAVFWLLILLPGALCWPCILRFVDPIPRFFICLLSSFALFTYLAYLDTLLFGVAVTLPSVWGIVCLAALWVNRGRVFRVQALWQWLQQPGSILLLGLLLVTVMIRIPPLFASILPQGYDPTNHLLLARLITVADGVPTNWMPFESVPLSYPVGLHNVMAVMNTCTIGFTVSWKVLFPVFGLLTALGLYSLILAATGKASAAWWGAALYSFCTKGGSLAYYGWGGMTNQAAMCTALAMLVLVCYIAQHGGARNTWRYRWIAGGLFAATYLIHPHVMVAAGGMFSFIMIVAFFRYRASSLHKVVFWSLAISCVLGSFHLAPLVSRSIHSGTQALSYLEPFIPPWEAVISISPILIIALLLGLPTMLRERHGMTAFVALLALAALLGAFCALEYAYQGIHYLVTEERSTPFLPSRFLNDAVLFMALPAGVGADWLMRRLTKRHVILAGIFAVLVLVPMPLYSVHKMCASHAGDDEFRALLWINDHTPPDAFIINSGTSNWVNFVCWRETSFTPLSASEAARQSKFEKFDQIRATRPVYGIGNYPGLKPIFKAGAYSVYEVRR